jgi:hypothetical protein
MQIAAWNGRWSQPRRRSSTARGSGLKPEDWPTGGRPGQRGSGLLPAGRGRGAGAWPPRGSLGGGARLGAWDCRSAACRRGRVGRWDPGLQGRLGRLGVAAGVVGWAAGTAGKGRE